MSRWLPLTLLLCARLHSAEWVQLFDGRSLEGWKPSVPDAAEFIIRDEAIVARPVAGKGNCVLCTEREYGDFILELEFKSEPGKNSGIHFRSELGSTYGNGGIRGYQLEIDPSHGAATGLIWDENRRGWLSRRSDQPGTWRAFKPNQWNQCRIEAIGDSIKIRVNGVLTTDVRDSMTLIGVVGLQSHPLEPDMETSFRNIRIQELGRHIWQPLWDGQSLEGWRATPGSHWKVTNGILVGTLSQGDSRPSLLIHDRTFGDLTLRCQFRVVRGRGALCFRAQKTEGPADIRGLQVELAPTYETGDLMEAGGRGWLVRRDPRDTMSVYNRGDWNELTVSAHGGRVVVQINNLTRAALEDEQISKEGHLALQLHGDQDAQVEFANIELLVPAAP